MLPYYLFFFTFAVLSLLPFRFDKGMERLAWSLAILLGTLFIGLRHEVGGDWINYVDNIRIINDTDTSVWLNFSKFDIGYQLIAFIGSRFGMGIYGANILSGFIVMMCLSFFAKRQPYPWITMAISVPFFLIAVNMGTIRQGLAVSIILVALTQINSSNIRYFFITLVAFFFHKSALIMFGLLFVKNISFYKLSFLILFLSVCYLIILRLDAIQTLLESYLIKPDYESDGALIRLAISFLPSAALFLFYKELNNKFEDNWVYLWIALATIFLILISGRLSTLADRLAYYSIPIQLAIWPRLIFVQKSQLIREYFAISIILGYLVILIVWLNFANHSFAWIPYDIVWFGQESYTTKKLCYHQWCTN